MFDVLIREIGQRFALGERAKELVGLLLGLIFAPSHGGFQGFLQRFRDAGLGTALETWVGRGENAVLPARSVQDALPQALIARLASHFGVPEEKFTSTLAAVLPSLLDKLTPDGVQPRGLDVPSPVTALVDPVRSELPGLLGLLPMPSAASVPATKHAGAHAPSPVPGHAPSHAASHAPATSHGHGQGDADHDAVTEHGGIGRWLGIAAAVMILVTGYYWFRGLGSEQGGALPGTGETVSRATFSEPDPDLVKRSGFQESGKPMPLTGSTLELRFAPGALSGSGALASDADIAQLRSAAEAVYGKENVALTLASDPRHANAWLPGLLQVLPAVRDQAFALNFDPSGIRLSGTTLDPEPTWLAGLRAAFQGFELNGFSGDAAIRALEALSPEQGVSNEALLAALNLMVVYFDSGKASIKPSSMEVLREAANVLRRLPQDRVLEVGGHTDHRGDPARNLALSEQRANAVVAALVAYGAAPSMLQAKGYGATVPVADNGTREGRAKNRRIAFRVLP